MPLKLCFFVLFSVPNIKYSFRLPRLGAVILGGEMGREREREKERVGEREKKKQKGEIITGFSRTFDHLIQGFRHYIVATFCIEKHDESIFVEFSIVSFSSSISVLMEGCAQGFFFHASASHESHASHDRQDSTSLIPLRQTLRQTFSHFSPRRFSPFLLSPPFLSHKHTQSHTHHSGIPEARYDLPSQRNPRLMFQQKKEQLARVTR